METLIRRHVLRHAANAARDLEAAAAPLRERSIYRGTPLLKALEDAHRSAVIAEREAERWGLRTAPQADAFEPLTEAAAMEAGDGAS